MSSKVAGFADALDNASDVGVDYVPRFAPANVETQIQVTRATANSVIENSLSDRW